MKDYKMIISAAILAVSVVILGLCLKSGIDSFVNRDRQVTVRGLCEKEVEDAFFDLFSGGIQMFIFIMLTMVFVGSKVPDEEKVKTIKGGN